MECEFVTMASVHVASSAEPEHADIPMDGYHPHAHYPVQADGLAGFVADTVLGVADSLLHPESELRCGAEDAASSFKWTGKEREKTQPTIPTRVFLGKARMRERRVE